MRKISLSLTCVILALSTSFATGIKIPPASLALFQTQKGETVPFEIQTASPQGSMVFGQGTMTISSNGTVSGSMDLTIFSRNSSSSSGITKVPFTGKIARPRKSREKIETGTAEAYGSADFLVDFSAKTVSSSNKRAPVYSVKGVLVYRYRMGYELSGNKITGSYNESTLDPKISVFGPNGEIGLVMSSD